MNRGGGWGWVDSHGMVEDECRKRRREGEAWRTGQMMRSFFPEVLAAGAGAPSVLQW